MLLSCSTRAPYVVDEAVGMETLSTLKVSCKKPYQLDQDCSLWNGATRKIEIEGIPARIAGSEDGKQILVMDGNPYLNAFKQSVSFTDKDYHSEGFNSGYDAIKHALTLKKIIILKVVPLVTFDRVDGYILELDKDGYSLLKEYSIED